MFKKIPAPNRVGIRFSDNDFESLFAHFLKRVGEEYSFYELTKPGIVDLWNRSSEGLYHLILRRNQPEQQHYDMKGKPCSFNPKEYLRLAEKDIYLDDEVDTYIAAQGGGCNREFHVVDLRYSQVPGWPYVYSV